MFARITLLLLLLIAAHGVPSIANAMGPARSKCPNDLQAWKDQRTSQAPLVTVSQRAAFQDLEYSLRVRAALSIYSAYVQGKALDWETCLAQDPEAQNFRDTLERVFFQETMKQLKLNAGPVLNHYLALAAKRGMDGDGALFRMTGHFSEASPTASQGGFHRATGSIFMALDRVAPAEWKLIFIHELLHALDEDLWQAMKNYSQPALVQKFAEWSNDYNNPQDLPHDEQEALAAWVRAGLGRGLWAEYRAWVPTFAIYKEATRSGVWQKVGWAEAILSEVEGDMRRKTYSFLDRRFPNPQSGIFSRPLIQNALNQERRATAQSENPISLGALECGYID